MTTTLSKDELEQARDLDLGSSDWTTIQQEQIQKFAEATHDQGLSGPINKTHPSSPPAQLRSVIFCYDLEPATGA